MDEYKLSEDKLLKIDNLRLKYQNSLTLVEAIRQRRDNLATELRVIPERLEKAEKDAESKKSAFESAYKELKEEFEVPDGKELNFETGEFVDTNR